MELIGQARSSAGGCKLALSLSQMQIRPQLLQPYCLGAFMALASPLHSLAPLATCLHRLGFNLVFSFSFIFVFYLGFFLYGFFGTREASKRDAMSANPQDEARTTRSASSFGCPAAFSWKHGLTDNSIRMGPSEVCHPNTSKQLRY
jgi:hypothetical protein